LKEETLQKSISEVKVNLAKSNVLETPLKQPLRMPKKETFDLKAETEKLIKDLETDLEKKTKDLEEMTKDFYR